MEAAMMKTLQRAGQSRRSMNDQKFRASILLTSFDKHNTKESHQLGMSNSAHYAHNNLAARTATAGQI
jgi:hypothetical protein